MKSVVTATPERALLLRPNLGGRRAIGVLTPSYGLERVSYMLPLSRYGYVKLPQLPLARLERRGSFLKETPWVAGPHVDLVHTFNQIAINRPFGVTVEMELPRYIGAEPSARQLRFGLKRLAHDNCRGIWPLSEAAAGYIGRRFARHGFADLADKIEVFRGAVSPVAAGAERTGYATCGPLQLLFVGGDGLRKGLGPTLEAVRRVREQGEDVRVTVIGQATDTCYLVPGARFDTAPVEALLALPWVTHHRALGNAEVRGLMGTHDVLAFPTMDESLGWVPCEAALSGMPTIATTIFALPELVLDGQDAAPTGWLIDVPLNEDRRWAALGSPDVRAQWEAAQAALTGRLVEVIADIAANRDEVARRGAAAQAHIAARYGVDVASAHLERLYDRAIAG